MSNLVCSRCGSQNVQILAWVNANTNEYKDEGPDNDSWCCDCEMHVSLVKNSEFNSDRLKDFRKESVITLKVFNHQLRIKLDGYGDGSIQSTIERASVDKFVTDEDATEFNATLTMAKNMAFKEKRELKIWNEISHAERLALKKDPSKAFIYAALPLGQMESYDIKGVPIDGYSAKRKQPLLFLTLGNPEAKGILLFDEINMAMPEVQDAAYEIITNRQIGENKKILILAAGKRINVDRIVSEEGVIATKYNAAIDALESLVLAHACAGIDVASPAYVSGIETSLTAIENQFS